MALLLLPVVYAQLDWKITDLRCGNGVLDEYELCEKNVEESRCDALADRLGIDMGCYEAHCTCVPKVNPTFCGNDRRDFNEMCDGDATEDMCPILGKILGNISLKCNKDTCGCDLNQTLPSDYNPVAVAKLVNQTQVTAVCGDKKVERDENCDPPNTLCTTNTNEVGICTGTCKCVTPEMFGVPETNVTTDTNVTMTNITETNVTIPATENVTPVTNITEEPKEPGFFGSIWAWIAGLFS